MNRSSIGWVPGARQVRPVPRSLKYKYSQVVAPDNDVSLTLCEVIQLPCCRSCVHLYDLTHILALYTVFLGNYLMAVTIFDPEFDFFSSNPSPTCFGSNCLDQSPYVLSTQSRSPSDPRFTLNSKAWPPKALRGDSGTSD
jgi:hypothetical protein